MTSLINDELTAKFGTSNYTRIDAPATPEQKNALKKLSPEAVTATELSDEAITAKLTRAPGNDAPSVVKFAPEESLYLTESSPSPMNQEA